MADTLSRVEVVKDNSFEHFTILEKYQGDPKLQHLINNTTSLQSKPILLTPNIVLYCDVSTGHNRPYIPKIFQQAICEGINSFSYPGRQATLELVKKTLRLDLDEQVRHEFHQRVCTMSTSVMTKFRLL